jgi:4'-phosphopantetheinyl transferase
VRAAVDVWAIDLAKAGTVPPMDLALLSEDERARYARYLVEPAAHAFATTRVALRRLLAARLGRSPGTVRIMLAPGGKPIVPDEPGVFFNVSHCATLALIALCEAAPIGIDVEESRTLEMDASLATMICTPSELAWLASQGPASFALMKLWTRKEAVLKAVGTGLSQPMSELELGGEESSGSVTLAAGYGRVAWRDLASRVGMAATIAVCGGEAMRIEVALRTYGA